MKLVLTAALWGGTFIAGRLVAPTVPPLVAASGRYLLASALLLALLLAHERRLPRLDARQLAATALLGLTGVFLYNLMFFSALTRLEAGRTSLIVSLNPVVTALGAWLILRDPMPLRRWIGIAVALLGVAIVVSRGAPATLLSGAVGLGELMMFCAVGAWATYTLIGRRVLGRLSPLAATTLAAMWGTLMLAVPGLAQLPGWLARGGTVQWSTVAALAYLGVAGTAIAFVWFYQGVKAVGPARAAVFTNLVPVFGVTFAALLLDEPVLASMVIGGLVAIAGVTLTNAPE
ncbi:MAG: DMT family transporter, partial [Burkholderiales bacterium]